MANHAPFHEIWETLRHRDQFETLDTGRTVRFDGVRKSLVRESELPDVGHLVTLGLPLGAGGNGEVFEAVQHPLPRVIAVKRPIGTDSESKQRLLQEAQVIGFLEHPSIPPVHFVGGGAAGELLVGIKRIEGETLGAKLSRESIQANLDENIDILIQICNAVGYAHSRGVIHQDLKPDNIMTGQFGQVYVLDWGLALAIRADVPAGIPRPDHEDTLRGTPSFVAPESVTNGPLSPATDVYQLGGILHMMLTGAPPNVGKTVMDALCSAYDPPVREFPVQTPPMLSDICRRALSPDPLERFPDAHGLHDSLLEYRRHRGLNEAAANARMTMQTLQHAIASHADPSAVYQAYGAARGAAEVLGRFGATQPEPQQAVLEAVIAWELERENLGGAEILLSEISSPDPALRSKCEVLRRAQDQERLDVSKLRDDVDPTLNVRSKAIFVMVIGAVIGLLHLIPYVFGVVHTAETALDAFLGYMVVLTLASLAFYRHVASTRMNRAVMLVIWQVSLFGLLCRVGGVLGIMPLYAVIGYDLASVALSNVFFAALLDKRVYVSVPVYAVASAICLSHPEQPMLVFGLAHFCGLNLLGLSMIIAPGQH